MATCLLFLKRPSVFKHVCCIFASRYDTFISARSVWFFSKLAVSFSLMVSCPLQDLSILRFISLNEMSLADLLDLLSIKSSQNPKAEGVTSAGSPPAVFHPGVPGALPQWPPPFHNPWGSSQAWEEGVLIQKDLALAFSTHLRVFWIGSPRSKVTG